MKYFGGNAIKKLISLIKNDLATKQPTITASGLLKGDGTTISAAVAGTDYQAPITFTDTPDGYIYKIDEKDISAKYDGSNNEIVTTYATKTEMNNKYTKPSDGIPKTDLAAAVQTSLGLADTALQSAPVTDVQINNSSILDGTVAKIVYETGLGSDSSNAATVTAIRAFVNSSIENVAAYYITSNTTGAAFATKAALDAGPWYYAGATRTPTRNDYAIVTADENHDGQSARYTYVKTDGQTTGQWAFQYTFNMSFTEAQINALNSGITVAKVTLYDAHLASTSNPHSITKAQVGLGNVDNVKQWADSNHPTTIGGYGITDANIVGNKITIGTNSVTPLTSVVLNGADSNSPAFYAPTTAGTSGQVLTSNGSGAPTWQHAPEAVHKYTATNSALMSSGGTWTWTIAASVHGINNNTMFVAIYEVATGDQVIADVKVNAANYAITITIVDSASAGSLSAGTYRVVAIG